MPDAAPVTNAILVVKRPFTVSAPIIIYRLDGSNAELPYGHAGGTVFEVCMPLLQGTSILRTARWQARPVAPGWVCGITGICSRSHLALGRHLRVQPRGGQALAGRTAGLKNSQRPSNLGFRFSRSAFSASWWSSLTKVTSSRAME